MGMEAKDFRIGNLLKSNEYGGVVQIECIKLEKYGFKIKANGFYHKWERGKYFDLRPIEVTGEILEQLGFGKTEILYEYGDFALKEWTVGRQEQWQVFLGDSHLGQFNDMAVHELQNLFFGLTGKELPIENIIKSNEMRTDKIIKTTDREIGHIIEEMSRIIRNVKLIKQGKTHTGDGVDRLDLIDECAKDINDRCCEM